MSTLTFYVSGIIETLGDKHGINIGCENMDDYLCYGLSITSQQTITQFLNKHRDLFDYLILDDVIENEPQIRLIRRPTGTDLEIDAVVKQQDCIFTSVDTPVIQFQRTDPMSLPREVEVQYISYDRGFAVNTQYACNEGARVQQAIMSIQSDFILSDAVARELAYAALYRMWARQLAVSFQHPDLTIEPGDIVQVEADQGVFVVEITQSMITKEPNSQSGMGRINQLQGQVFLTRRGAAPLPGTVSTSTKLGVFHLAISPTVSGVGEAA